MAQDQTSDVDVRTSALRPPNSAVEMLAELERILGSARGVAEEVRGFAESAAKASTESELARLKAAEHVNEIESKTVMLQAEAAKVISLREEINAQRVQLQEVGSEVAKVRDNIVEIGAESTKQKDQIMSDAELLSEKKEEFQDLIRQFNTVQAQAVAANTQLEVYKDAALQIIDASEKARDSLINSQINTTVSAETAALSCKNIEDGRAYVETTQAEVAAAAAKIESSNEEVAEILEKVKTLFDNISTTQENADSVLDEVKKFSSDALRAKESAEASQSATEKLAEIAATIEDRVMAYESKLAELQKTYSEVNSKIESLLPGAASAGLAAAFHKQKLVYAIPRRLWNAAFLIALAGLMSIGLAKMYRHWTGPTPDYQEIARSVVARLPVVAALVWLALHAGHKSRIASHIEQDYAFKEVVSKSFEGYRKEFASLEQEVRPDSPLSMLCSSVVGIVSTSPSRVYDKHSDDPTIMSTCTEAAKQATALVKELKSPISAK